MTKSDVLVCGTGKTLNNLTDEEINSYPITIGCNFIWKRFTPTFTAVNDIEVFFKKSGWDKFLNLNTVWIFPKCTEKMFHDVPEHVKMFFYSPKKKVLNSLFDMALPMASLVSRIKQIDVAGIGGYGHFYDEEDDDGGIRPSMPIYKEVFDLYKEHSGLTINIIGDN